MVSALFGNLYHDHLSPFVCPLLNITSLSKHLSIFFSSKFPQLSPIEVPRCINCLLCISMCILHKENVYKNWEQDAGTTPSLAKCSPSHMPYSICSQNLFHNIYEYQNIKWNTLNMHNFLSCVAQYSSKKKEIPTQKRWPYLN